MDKDDSIIARIDERIIHLGADLESHISDDADRFEKMIAHLKEGFSGIEARFDRLEQKAEAKLHGIESRIAALWDNKNNWEGALNFGKWMAGLIGAILGAAAAFLAFPHGGGL